MTTFERKSTSGHLHVQGKEATEALVNHKFLGKFVEYIAACRIFWLKVVLKNSQRNSKFSKENY